MSRFFKPIKIKNIILLFGSLHVNKSFEKLRKLKKSRYSVFEADKNVLKFVSAYLLLK